MYVFQNNPQVKENNHKEIKKYLKLNDEENTVLRKL